MDWGGEFGEFPGDTIPNCLGEFREIRIGQGGKKDITK